MEILFTLGVLITIAVVNSLLEPFFASNKTKKGEREYNRGYNNAMKFIKSGRDPKKSYYDYSSEMISNDEYDRGFLKACIDSGAETLN